MDDQDFQMELLRRELAHQQNMNDSWQQHYQLVGAQQDHLAQQLVQTHAMYGEDAVHNVLQQMLHDPQNHQYMLNVAQRLNQIGQGATANLIYPHIQPQQQQ